MSKKEKAGAKPLIAVRLMAMVLLALARPAATETAWQTRATDHFQLRYPGSLEQTAQELLPELEPLRAAIMADLATRDEARILVVLAPDQETFFALQPPGVPAWASGTSYPQTRTIFLRPLDPRELRANTLSGVLAHELAHLLLHRRCPRGLPRWLDEGLANRYGRSLEWDFPGPLFGVGITGNYLPFDTLRDGFPEAGPQARLAYAESTDFVQFLKRTYGPAAFNTFLDRLAAGEEEEAALRAAFGRDLAELSSAWLKHVRFSYGLVGLLAGGISLWFGISLLALWAYARKRKTSRLRRELWELEDRAAALSSQDDDDPAPPPTVH